MKPNKLAAYISAFNVLKNGFDYVTPLRAALTTFDEVVVAVNTSEDAINNREVGGCITIG